MGAQGIMAGDLSSTSGWTGALSPGGVSGPSHMAMLRTRPWRILQIMTAVGLIALLGYSALQWDSILLRGNQWSHSDGFYSSFLFEGYRIQRMRDEMTGCNGSCLKLIDDRGIRSWHFWSDEELFKAALEVKRPIKLLEEGPPPPQKIAFLFLTREGVVHIELWERYFQGYKGLYSIYIHVADPAVRLYKRSKLLWGRQIPSEKTAWGSTDLVDAEKRMLANAYLDPLNERFILLSESCIPIQPFPALHSFLRDSPKSWVGCFNQPSPNADGRWHDGFLPLVPRELFRKGSQWFELQRRHVQVVLEDVKYWNETKWLWLQPEEHYIPTLFYLLGLQDEIWHGTLTAVDWSRPEGTYNEHPHSYLPSEITPNLIKTLQGSNREFFFARKFGAGTVQPVLSLKSGAFGF